MKYHVSNRNKLIHVQFNYFRTGSGGASAHLKIAALVNGAEIVQFNQCSFSKTEPNVGNPFTYPFTFPKF